MAVIILESIGVFSKAAKLAKVMSIDVVDAAIGEYAYASSWSFSDCRLFLLNIKVFSSLPGVM